MKKPKKDIPAKRNLQTIGGRDKHGLVETTHQEQYNPYMDLRRRLGATSTGGLVAMALNLIKSARATATAALMKDEPALFVGMSGEVIKNLRHDASPKAENDVILPRARSGEKIKKVRRDAALKALETEIPSWHDALLRMENDWINRLVGTKELENDMEVREKFVLSARGFLDELEAFSRKDIERGFALTAERNQVILREIELADQGKALFGQHIPQKAKQENQAQWSMPPRTKDVIVTLLKLDSVYKLNQLVEQGLYELRQVGENRQAWQIRLDKLPPDIQKKFTSD